MIGFVKQQTCFNLVNNAVTRKIKMFIRTKSVTFSRPWLLPCMCVCMEEEDLSNRAGGKEGKKERRQSGCTVGRRN
jgi:hypothetical protein